MQRILITLGLVIASIGFIYPYLIQIGLGRDYLVTLFLEVKTQLFISQSLAILPLICFLQSFLICYDRPGICHAQEAD